MENQNTQNKLTKSIETKSIEDEFFNNTDETDENAFNGHDYKVKNPYENAKLQGNATGIFNKKNATGIFNEKIESFNKLPTKEKERILKSAKICITEEELEHAKRFLALTAITGGQMSSTGNTSLKEVSLKEVYVRQGILPNYVKITSDAIAIQEKIIEVSKQITNKNILNFYKRLLEKRPLYFYMSNDSYKQRDGFGGNGCPGDKDPFEYLLYSEIEFGALLGVSADTYFINKGDRGNSGKVESEDNYQKTGNITGIVGARFEDDNLPDQYHFNLKNKKAILKLFLETYGKAGNLGRITNVKKDFVDGYNYIWDKFLGIEKKEPTQIDLDKALKKRISNSYKKIFSQAINNNDKEKAYIRISGIGDGVWAGGQTDKIQKIIGEVTADIVKSLTREQKSKIAKIEFSQFKHDNYSQAFNASIGNDQDQLGSIKISSNTSAPHSEKLEGVYKDCKLYVLFAWDGNSMPGNEFWRNNLDASSDPAAACASTITITHDPHINKHLTSKVYVIDKVLVMKESPLAATIPQFFLPKTKLSLDSKKLDSENIQKLNNNNKDAQSYCYCCC